MFNLKTYRDLDQGQGRPGPGDQGIVLHPEGFRFLQGGHDTLHPGQVHDPDPDPAQVELRPLSGFLGKVGVKHNGVVATTKDGGRWLIHKGPGYGKSSDTVVTNAKHMSSQWKPAGSKSARDGTTIGGLVKAGLANKKYNLWNAKCWDATDGRKMKGVALLTVIVILAIIVDSEAWFFCAVAEFNIEPMESVTTSREKLAWEWPILNLYIDDVLSINNPKFADYLSSIYPSELEVKETTETNNSASYLDIMLSYDTDGHMNTSLYDKRDDFNFSITNFPFLSSNIPSSPAYGVFISQLIRYARASTKYTDFVLRARRLSDKLLSQGYVCDRLTSSLRKFYGRYGELVIHYDVPLYRMVDDILSWTI
ncbi:hypothetical protein FSP39_021730 [Pinctada imbricata]|uniref:Uncharacterized protein n=1 Tax=Pinctada imbricata TaxID=66713 RepID=A0AA89C8D8_PINIB|nr:hypothetical protein FSP39_021730 [Pinctada imbricata]